jgi:hypothetical protein
MSALNRQSVSSIALINDPRPQFERPFLMSPRNSAVLFARLELFQCRKDIFPCKFARITWLAVRIHFHAAHDGGSGCVNSSAPESLSDLFDFTALRQPWKGLHVRSQKLSPRNEAPRHLIPDRDRRSGNARQSGQKTQGAICAGARGAGRRSRTSVRLAKRKGPSVDGRSGCRNRMTVDPTVQHSAHNAEPRRSMTRRGHSRHELSGNIRRAARLRWSTRPGRALS